MPDASVLKNATSFCAIFFFIAFSLRQLLISFLDCP